MSHTELYAVNKEGNVEFFDKVQNSWAGGMHVWNTLSDKYNFNDNIFTSFKSIWGQFNQGIYEEYEDIVLGSTFDFVLVKKENLEELVKAFEKYSEVHEGSNLLKQVDIIKKVKENPECIAIGWCQTSVVNDMWDYDYHEESDRLISYNIYKGDKHWFLFDDLENKGVEK